MIPKGLQRKCRLNKMDKILMLKNKEVYNITKEKILDYDLLPIYLKKGRKDINLFLFNEWGLM